MTVLLYGVLPVPAPEPPPGVRALDTPAGVAWVRTLAHGETPTLDEQRRTLSVALGAGTPVPARAGTRFDDDDALTAALAGSAESWRAALERVRGRVEMMVFLPVGDDVTARDDERPGRAYLERVRARLVTPAERQRETLRHALGELAAEEAVVAHPSGRGVLVSHLVPRERADEYRARVRAWRASAGAARAVVVGPWPPFSFASDELR